MVNWKTSETRLIAAIVAAHPGLKLDYHTMAVMFGQGVTYEALTSRFRLYNKQAAELRTEAEATGAEVPPPRGKATPTKTPRGPRGGITKSTSASGSARKSGARGVAATPTKRGSKGKSIMESIFVDETTSEEMIKDESSEGNAEVVGTAGSDVEVVEAPTAPADAVVKTENHGQNPGDLRHVFGIKAEDSVQQLDELHRLFGIKTENTHTSMHQQNPATLASVPSGHSFEYPSLEPVSTGDPFNMAGTGFSHVDSDHQMGDIYGDAV